MGGECDSMFAAVPEERKSGPVLLLLGVSASLSLYTTTFSVLEYYYIKMLTAGDTYAGYLNTVLSEEDEKEALLEATGGDSAVAIAAADARVASAAAANVERDLLGRKLDEMIMNFARLRKWARNSLWCSVRKLLASPMGRRSRSGVRACCGSPME